MVIKFLVSQTDPHRRSSQLKFVFITVFMKFFRGNAYVESM